MTRSLHERLRQFDGAPRVERREVQSTELIEVLGRGARWAGTPGESHLRIERPLAELPATVLPHSTWSALVGCEPPPFPWVVLDTETTGLEAGAGILVFLVGLIVWDEHGARLVQLLLADPAHENGLLDELLEEVIPAGAFLSYNGKTFDVPRLISRLRLHRYDTDGLFDKPHLDLLHPTRRITREWFGDARLASVERELLDVHRVADLSGWEVPEAYREFLITGDDTDLARVLDHNEQDVVSLLRLAPILGDCFTGGERARELPPEAKLGLGRALFTTGNFEPAVTCLGWACEEGDEPVRRKARWLRFLLWRRRKEYDHVHRELSAMVEEWPTWVAARVELAKLLEHRRRDPVAAKEQVLVAMGHAERAELMGAPRQRAELTHRLRRLERKARRA